MNIRYLIKKIIKLLTFYKKRDEEINDEFLHFELNKLFDGSEKEVKKFKSLITDLLGTSAIEAINILRSLKDTKMVNGDVCEFGVAQGKTSKLIASYIKDSEKKLFLFDSFNGLPPPSKEDELKDDIFNLKEIANYTGKMAHSENKVISELKEINFDNQKMVINKGFFSKENSHLNNFPKEISFAYLDFDFYKPTKDVLEVINPLLKKNSQIIVDDYDFFSTGVKKAVDDWFDNSKFSQKKIRTSKASFIIIKKII